MNPEENPSDPVDSFLEGISEIMEKMVKNQANAIQGTISKEIRERLAVVEQQVAFLKRVSEETARAAGITPEEIKASIANPDKLGEREKEFIKKSEKLKKEITKKQEALRTSVKEKEKEVKKKSTTRKKKFDRTGARKNWKPL